MRVQDRTEAISVVSWVRLSKLVKERGIAAVRRGFRSLVRRRL